MVLMFHLSLKSLENFFQPLKYIQYWEISILCHQKLHYCKLMYLSLNRNEEWLVSMLPAPSSDTIEDLGIPQPFCFLG